MKATKAPPWASFYCNGTDGKRVRIPASTLMKDGVDYRPKLPGRLPISVCKCWNFMTPAQQDLLRVDGIIDRRPGGLGYGGGACANPAAVAVKIGNNHGPRFYCHFCAVKARATGLAKGGR